MQTNKNVNPFELQKSNEDFCIQLLTLLGVRYNKVKAIFNTVYFSTTHVLSVMGLAYC